MNSFVAVLFLAATASASWGGHDVHGYEGHGIHGYHAESHIPSGSISVGHNGVVVAGPSGSVHTDNGLHGHGAGARLSGPAGEVGTHGGHAHLAGPGLEHGHGHVAVVAHAAPVWGHGHAALGYAGHTAVVGPSSHATIVGPSAHASIVGGHAGVYSAPAYGHAALVAPGYGYGGIVSHGIVGHGHGHHGW